MQNNNKTNHFILIAALPDFNKSYKYHKQMRSGIGYRQLRHYNSRNKPRTIHPIMDMLYGASILRKKGLNVLIDDDQYYDSLNLDNYKKNIVKKFINPPDAVFIRLSQPSIKTDILVTKELRSIWSKSSFHAFGPMFVSKDLFDYVASQNIFDSIITSEFEAVTQLINDNIDNIYNISGVYKKDYKGNYLSNSNIKLNTVMKDLPFAAYDLVDYNKLDRFIIQTQRGCPLACNYCPYYLGQGHNWRSKTPDQIVEELSYYKRKFNMNKFVFHDPIFSLDRKRVIEICNKLIESNLNVEWETETHMNHINPDILSLMYKAGLTKLSFGIESADAEVLKKANRGFKNWDLVSTNIKACKKLGITTTGYFILALPGDTIKSVLNTLKLAWLLKIDNSRFNLPSSYPGTGAYDEALKEGMLNIEKFKGDLGDYFVGLVTEGTSLDIKKTRISHSNFLSDKQAMLFLYIANHLYTIRKNNSFVISFFSFLKILFYFIIILFENIFNTHKPNIISK